MDGRDGRDGTDGRDGGDGRGAGDAGDAVRAAFALIARQPFLPENVRARGSTDAALPIGFGQTNSQPRTVEAMLRLLDVRPGQRVLDVGAGSGWTTALLAHLTGSSGSVVGVEIVPELVRRGAANVAATGQAWATIRSAVPGVRGLPDEAPFDRILVSAGADALPAELVEQLGDPGRMVIPVNGEMLLVVRDGDVNVSEHGRYRFVPLQ